MAKATRRRKSRREAGSADSLPLEKENFIILGVGLVTIIAGYLAMLGAPVEGVMPLVVSPILLVLGYCVIIPFGLLYRKRATAAPAEAGETPNPASTA